MPRALDDKKNLGNWEPWVRASIIDFDLLSHLHFTTHRETFTYKDHAKTVSRTPRERSVTVWHFQVHTTPNDPAPKTRSSRIATFIRPSPAVFQSQLDFLDQYSDLREDRLAEIVTELGPQYAFWSSVVNLHPDRTKKTIELLDAALRFANAVEMRIKHAMACWRPYELSPQVQPIILTPGHGTFPSGHSTENHMIARILWELYGREPNLGEQLMRQAARIAVNRTVAGVHFPVDTAAGQVLGLSLARYFIQRAKGGTKFNAWRFDGERYPGNQDFDFHDFYDSANGHEKLNPLIDPPYVDPLASMPPAVSPIMKWLWDAAQAEVI
ncbi:phosphatase PAP2 family protein [Tardiphaga sp.]|uniref:phosphatase PAP2 family protein n=1 Tax=Tardiphaga sp. TaxID=1926292 RepID=UPI00352B0911